MFWGGAPLLPFLIQQFHYIFYISEELKINNNNNNNNVIYVIFLSLSVHKIFDQKKLPRNLHCVYFH